MKIAIACIIVYGLSVGGNSAIEELEKNVSQKTQEGYESYGTVSCVDSKDGLIKCYQPMVKYKEESNE